MIEAPPTKSDSQEIFDILLNPMYVSEIEKINDEYLYWDKVKYHTPKGIDAENLALL